MRVALDAMGGDHAPREIVAGALDATRADPEVELVLVGRRDELSRELDEQGGAPAAVTIEHAADVVGMHDSPVEGLKRNPDASILRAIHLLRAGDVDGVVSAGSTGAAVAAATLGLKRLRGVKRPGIGVPMPAVNRNGACLLIDGGANPESRPHHLAQYAVMGANYYRHVFKTDDPRVALLSIGEEEAKGTTLTREAARLIRTAPVRFVGNVENFFAGGCDVAVADGFVGNIVLKSAEGVAEMLLTMMREVIGADHPEVVGAVASRVHYTEFGGAPLLGVDGVLMICHGRSDRRAIANAVAACRRAIVHNVNDAIVEGLEELGGEAEGEA